MAGELPDCGPTAGPRSADPFGQAGCVYWFTGLSGAGKTTLASRFAARLRAANLPSVYLDGDVLRSIFEADADYSLEGRRRAADRNARLCRALAEQGLAVVCATISLFHARQAENRRSLPGYVEISVRAGMATLKARDPHGLYAGAAAGTIKNVVGVDLPAEFPETPDFEIDNDGLRSPDDLVDMLWAELQPTARAA